MIKCPRCNKSTHFTLLSIFYANSYVEIKYRCKCTAFTTVTRMSYENYYKIREGRIKPWVNL